MSDRRQKLLNYLLWLQERGLSTLKQAAPLAPPAPLQEQASVSERGPATEAFQHKLLWGAGARQARLLGILALPFSQKPQLLLGSSRALVLKMLAALGLDLRQDVYLAAFALDAQGCPLAARQDYQKDLAELCGRLAPRVLLSFGAQAAQLIDEAAEPRPFTAIQHHALTLSYLPQNSGWLPLLAPDALVQDPSLKRQTWQALQQAIALLKQG